jgi:hypothetical protein
VDGTSYESSILHMRPLARIDSSQMAVVLAGFALGVTACQFPLGAPQVPDDVAIPDTIGIIASSQQEDDGRLVTLEDGTRVLLPNDATDLTGPAADGRLLIIGQGGPAAPDGGVWYAAVPLRPSGCFILSRANGEIRGDRLALSLGFSLPLSDQWDESETTFVQSPPVGFCLDDAGTVVRPYS